MAFDPNKWTLKTQEVFNKAVSSAREVANPEVTPDHLLSAMLSQPDSIVLPLLTKIGVQPAVLKRDLDAALARLPKSHGSESTVGRSLRDLLERADAERSALADEYLSIEHLLLAMTERLKVTRDDVLGGLQTIRGSQRITSQTPEDTFQALEKYGRDLTAEWVKQYPRSQYVTDKKQLAAVDPAKTKHLLGLFNPTSMEFEYDRTDKKSGEPSLTEMTTKAIDVVAKNKKGFFLMIEAGRIDQAHHYGNAYRALSDTVELSNAVRAALSKVNLDETLIIVTADHNHTFTMMGYPARGNNILGLVREVAEDGTIQPNYKLDKTGMPFTTLSYVSGRGYTGESADQPEGPKTFPVKAGAVKPTTRGRADLTRVDTTNPNYEQEAMIPLADETHGGEDVPIFAIGPNAHLIRGSMEQNWIFYVMADAMGLGRK